MELSFVFFILLLITLPYDHRVKSQLIYERLTYYLDTSTSAQNMTCQGCTTIHQSSTMASPNMMEFKINTAYGYQNLFYTLELHTQIQSTPTITFYESGITVQMIETKIQMKLNSFICSQATYIFLIQFTSITYMNEQQVTLLVSSNSQNIFWIKNLNIYAQRCQPNCKKCSASDCQECMNDFEFNELRVCQCKQQFLTFFEGQCITQCPVNHIFDGETCLKYNQLINLFYDDTASKFTMKPDYNTTLRESKITLEGQLVAGLFIQNEAVEYQINYPTGSVFNILLKLEIYLLNYSKNLKQLQLFIKYNQILVSQKELIYNELFDTRKQIKPIQCNIIGFTSCFKLTIHQYIQNISDISSLQLYMNLPFERQEVSWAISKVQLDGITISPINCPQKRFENQCYDECPLISRSLGDECISILNDYKFSNILDVSYSDRSVQNQKIDIYNPCDLLQFSPYPYCNFYQKRYILGGFQIWQNNQTQLVLESMKPHYKVKLFFKAILIDPVDISLNLTVSIDQTKYILNKNSPNSYCFSSVATSGCIIQEDLGQTTADYLINFEQEFDHSKTTLEVFLVCNAQKLSMSYCALYDLIILQINCPENCLVCQSNSNCLKKDQDLPVFYECARDGYFLSEGSCKKCLDFCKTCSNAYSCLTCKDQYFQYGNLCICKLNQVNAMHSSCSNDCHSSCSICQNQLTQNTLLKLIKFDQLCAFCDPNEHKVFNVDICECFSGYYMDTKISPSNCQLCSEKCKTCSDGKFCTTCYSEQNRIYEDYDCKCKEGYFQNGLDPNCIKCMNFCKSCLYKEEYCIQCYPEQYRVLSKENTCICQIGYYDNKSDVCLKCSDNCNSCINYSICTSCNEFQFRKLDKINKECICQLGYYDNNDLTCLPCYYACSTCNKSSLKSQCTLCPKTRQKSTNSLETFECKCRKGYFDDGYLECQPCVNLINPPITHYCYSFCGDLIVQWNEECDDGNLDPRDGCHKCFIQNDNCIDNICLKCQNNMCLLCIDGYYLNHDSACIKCSDECQTCEQNYDNCTQCKFYNSTSQECIICVQEYGFLQIDNQCFSICGDGIKTFQEHCDDGNQINGDGCDQYCFVEDGHICDFECQQINYIEIQLQENKFDTIYDSKRSISLKFNQDVRIDTNTSITKLILVTSTTPNLQLTLLSISDSSKIINDYYNIELNLNIELKSSAKSPSIQITIKNSTLFTNHQGYSFKQNSATIYLIDFVQQDEIVIEITQNLIQINSYFLYIFLGLAILALLFGGLDIFWNLLDTLQLICYLKYFNVTYPYNLNHYFMIFGFAEFDFIKSYFNFEYLITEYVDTPQADPKFYLEGYSTVFLVNFISVVIVFLTTFLTFITMKMTSLLLHNIIKDFSEDRILLERNQINIFTFLFYKFTNSCQKYCLQVSNNFKRALIRTFMASAYDFNLAIFLQFKDLNFENPILRISSLCAIMAFLYEIYFIYSCLQLANKNNSSLQQNTIKQHYEPIFEGLDLDKNQFNFYFNILNIVKKAIFMAFLVFLYDAPCIQISLVSLLSLLQALFLLLNRCLEDQNELIKQISCESILWLSAILILMYGFNEESQILNSANITNIGWSIIGFLSLLIFIQLIIDIKQHFLFLDEKYKLLKHLRLWYLYYFQSHIYQSSLNTEQSQFQVVNNKKSKKQSRVQKVQTLENQPNQRIIISFSIS